MKAWTAAGIAVLLAAVAGFWWLGAPDPEAEIREVVLRQIRALQRTAGREEGRDYTVGEVRIVVRSSGEAVTESEIRPAGPILYHSLRLNEGSWIILQDLQEDFGKFARQEEQQARVQDRMASRVQERFGGQVGLQLREGITYDYSVQRVEQSILGNLVVAFSFYRDGKPVQSARYCESYRYERGGWILEGGGQLFESAGGPSSRPAPPDRPQR